MSQRVSTHCSAFDLATDSRSAFFLETLEREYTAIEHDHLFGEGKSSNAINSQQVSQSGGLEASLLHHATKEIDQFDSLLLHESVFVMIEAYKRSSEVEIFQTRNNLYEIRLLAGFSWDRLADILNIDQETMIIWVRGHDIADEHASHIACVLSALRYVDRGDARQNAQELDKVDGTGSAFDLIKSHKYSEAIQAIGPGIGRPERTKSKQYRVGDSTPIFTHDVADGDEELMPIPYEPEPAGTRVRVRK